MPKFLTTIDIALLRLVLRTGQFLQVNCRIHRFWIVNGVSASAGASYILASIFNSPDGTPDVWGLIWGLVGWTPWLLAWRDNYKQQYPKGIKTSNGHVNREVYKILMTRIIQRCMIQLVSFVFVTVMTAVSLTLGLGLQFLTLPVTATAACSLHVYIWHMGQHEIPPKEYHDLVPQGA